MASRVGRWGATRRTTCTASSRSGTSTWIWAPQMCCSLTSTWYSCCMCANRAPAEMSPPSTSTSGTVPAATTPRPCGSAASASRARSRCRCARSSSRVSHTGVFVSTSDRCSSGANSSPSSWPRSASTSGVDRRVSRSTTWNSSSAPIWSSRLLMAATVGSVCYADVARGSPGVAAGARGRLPARRRRSHLGWRRGCEHPGGARWVALGALRSTAVRGSTAMIGTGRPGRHPCPVRSTKH